VRVGEGCGTGDFGKNYSDANPKPQDALEKDTCRSEETQDWMGENRRDTTRGNDNKRGRKGPHPLNRQVQEEAIEKGTQNQKPSRPHKPGLLKIES